MPARDPAVRSASARLAAIERHHPGADTTALRRDLRLAQAAAYLRDLKRDLDALGGSEPVFILVAGAGDAA